MITGEPAPRLIDGRFELLQCLGGGGMGLVWRARDTALQRDVALKEVRPPEPGAGNTESGDPRELRQRVLREARALARLHHPNVVIIHHIVDTPEHPHPWLVMELVSGGSLADRLERGPLSVAEAVRIGRGVLSALRAAHSVGVLHRDIKPANVLLHPDGSPVLTDFGIAAMRDATSLTVAGSILGSPEYIAPERLRGEEGNPSSDLWSLAMMLYVAVEGRHPLRRASMLATLAAVLNEPLPPPLRAGPLGPALAAMLAKDPNVRPDGEQFDRLLASAEQGHPMTSPLPPPAWSQQVAMPQVGMPSQTMQGPLYPPGTRGRTRSGVQDGYPTRQVRRGRALPAVLLVGVLVAGGVITWSLIPHATGTGLSGTAGAGQTSVVRSTTGQGAAPTDPARDVVSTSPPTPAAPADLLTPDGVRAVLGAMKPFMGTKALELVIYSNYASAEAPTSSDPKLYDEIDYRDGTVTHSPGGTVDSTMDAPVDLNAIDWDILPTLLRKAQDTLNVANPTVIYLMVESDMNITDSGDTTLTPVIRIYRSDDYGGGMLTADLRGNVLQTVPRS